MVSLKLIPIFSIFFTLNAFAQKPVRFVLPLNPNHECGNVIFRFLEEAKTMSNDQIIEILNDEQVAKTEDASLIKLRCSLKEKSVQGVMLNDERESFFIKYINQKAGFDSLDWIPFQQKYFAIQTEEVNFSDLRNPQSTSKTTYTLANPDTDKSKSARNFGWVALGSVASGTTGAILSPNRESIFLNAVVFGAVGAIGSHLLFNLFD